MNFRIVLAAIVGVVCLGMWSCKTANQSSLQSLDNFSRNQGAGVSVNSCRGEFGADFDLYWGENAGPDDRIHVDSPHKEALKDSIRAALTAVPDGLQNWFFDKGGKLVFSQDAANLCTSEAKAKNMLTENVRGYAGCWRMENGAFPQIIVNSDPAVTRLKFEGTDDVELLKKEIEHSVVRAFGYVVSEVLTKLKPQESGEVSFEMGSGDAQFQKDRELLAWKFLTDIRNHKRDQNESINLGIYGAMIKEQTVLDPSVSYEDAWRQWYLQYKSYNAQTQEETFKEGPWAEKARRFQDFVFAETFDSYYCNTETRAQLQGATPVFQYTGNYFVQVIAPGLESAFAEYRVDSPGVSDDGGDAPGGDGIAGGEGVPAVPAGPGEWDEGDKINAEGDSSDGKINAEADGGKLNNEADGGKINSAEADGKLDGLGAEEAPMEMKVSGMQLTGLRYPILTALFAVRGAIRYTGSAVATWARNRNARVNDSLVRGQPVRNTLRILNGGPAGWRAQRWRETGGFQPVQRLRRGCLVRRWRC